MTQKEILESYVDDICDNLDTGNVPVDIKDYYEVQGMLRICYVMDIISEDERSEFRGRLFESWYKRYGI
ncbi:MAG: hypothetical protein IJ514_03025 [Clostridia bacterium]|nr:hypothetical protein [Clostridia bacterium]